MIPQPCLSFFLACRSMSVCLSEAPVYQPGSVSVCKPVQAVFTWRGVTAHRAVVCDSLQTLLAFPVPVCLSRFVLLCDPLIFSLSNTPVKCALLPKLSLFPKVCFFGNPSEQLCIHLNWTLFLKAIFHLIWFNMYRNSWPLSVGDFRLDKLWLAYIWA